MMSGIFTDAKKILSADPQADVRQDQVRNWSAEATSLRNSKPLSTNTSHLVSAVSTESPSDLANQGSAASPSKSQFDAGRQCHPCLCSSHPENYRNKIASPARS